MTVLLHCYVFGFMLTRNQCCETKSNASANNVIKCMSDCMSGTVCAGVVRGSMPFKIKQLELFNKNVVNS